MNVGGVGLTFSHLRASVEVIRGMLIDDVHLSFAKLGTTLLYLDEQNICFKNYMVLQSLADLMPSFIGHQASEMMGMLSNAPGSP